MTGQMNQIPDLSFRVNSDGSIDIEQGYTDVAVITLHTCHVRYLFEVAGHLLPPPTADELSKRLARQLCSVLRDLCDEAGRSPGVDSVIDTLIAYKESLPESVFPFDLYPDDSAQENPQQDAARPDFRLTHPTTKEHRHV